MANIPLNFPELGNSTYTYVFVSFRLIDCRTHCIERFCDLFADSIPWLLWERWLLPASTALRTNRWEFACCSSYQSEVSSLQVSKTRTFLINFFSPNFSIKIGDTISLEVASAKELESVYYVVSARGNLLSSTIVPGDNQKIVAISLQATFDMVPNAQFVAYYISSDGNIVAGRIEIPVTGLNNFVSFL